MIGVSGGGVKKSESSLIGGAHEARIDLITAKNTKETQKEGSNNVQTLFSYCSDIVQKGVDWLFLVLLFSFFSSLSFSSFSFSLPPLPLYISLSFGH
jgi:Mg/Co/Ni transporter MgtE